MTTTITGPDGKPRCGWCGTVEAFFAYHDSEWGFPVGEDRRLFKAAMGRIGLEVPRSDFAKDLETARQVLERKLCWQQPRT